MPYEILLYELRPGEPFEAERILHNAIVEQMVASSGDQMVPLTLGSTRPVALTVRHAGLVRVLRYAFSLPRASP